MITFFKIFSFPSCLIPSKMALKITFEMSSASNFPQAHPAITIATLKHNYFWHHLCWFLGASSWRNPSIFLRCSQAILLLLLISRSIAVRKVDSSRKESWWFLLFGMLIRSSLRGNQEAFPRNWNLFFFASPERHQDSCWSHRMGLSKLCCRRFSPHNLCSLQTPMTPSRLWRQSLAQK